MLIIPTYNERGNVATLISRIRKAVPEEPIFFVDDNSPDGTADAIREIQKTDAGVHLMARPGKGGYGSACRDAMRKILAENLAPYVIQFDADLSHPPELLPIMIETLRTSSVAIGSRYVAGGGSRNWDFRRKLLSFGGNLYARTLTGVPVHDMTSGFVGYQVDILRKIDLTTIRSEGYAFLMEMKFRLQRHGATFKEFPIVFVDREAGKSKFSRRIMYEGVRFPLKAMRVRLHLGS
ncbi:MAG: polyprenol monophosphomannose synthase [Candidatus Solibacter sp.]